MDIPRSEPLVKWGALQGLQSQIAFFGQGSKETQDTPREEPGAEKARSHTESRSHQDTQEDGTARQGQARGHGESEGKDSRTRWEGYQNSPWGESSWEMQEAASSLQEGIPELMCAEPMANYFFPQLY